MEILTNSANRKAYLEVPVTPLTNTMNVTVSRGDLYHEISSVTAESPGVYAVVIPYIFAQYDSQITIEWAFEYQEGSEIYDFVTKTFVDVVTPYVNTAELTAILGHQGFTEEQMASAEQAVRHVINSHVGQQFGNFVGKKQVWSRGGQFLPLPDRLRSLKTVDGYYDHGFSLDGSGFILHQRPFGVPSVKADFHGYHMHVGGVIHNPNNVRLAEFATRSYEIDGEWGYENVPQPVKEAAVLLVADYADPDSQYRDRYLTSMTAADWRIQFHSEAFARTGNARADQLLSPFIVKGHWTVI